MAAAYVATYKADSGASTVTTLTVTVSGATSGNVLLGCIFPRYGTVALTRSVSGWEPVSKASGSACQFGPSWWWRVADGTSADDFAPTWSGTAYKATGIVQEFSGVDTTAPICGISYTDHPKTITSAATTVTTTSIAPQKAAGIRVSTLVVVDKQDWALTNDGGGITIPSGFSNSGYSYGTNANEPLLMMASKTFSDTTSVSSTWSTSDDGGDGWQGVFEVFLAEDEYATLPTFVREYATHNSTDGQTSGTLTLNGTGGPDPGNLLVAACTRVNTTGGDSITATGWTKISEFDASVWTGAWFYREATGDANDDFSPSWTDGSTYDLLVGEWTGITVGTPEDTTENEAEINNTAATTINTGSVTPTSDLSLAITLFATDVKNHWAFEAYGYDLDGDGDYQYVAAGKMTGGDAYSKLGMKVLHGTNAESFTTDKVTGLPAGGEAYAAIAVFTSTSQPNTGFQVLSLETDDWLHAEGETVTAVLSNAAATGKKVYIRQDGTSIPQTVTDEGTDFVTFVADYGSLIRKEATLVVEDG